MYEILKPFFYAVDTYTSARYMPGEVKSVSDDLSPGLLEEKFIREIKPAKGK